MDDSTTFAPPIEYVKRFYDFNKKLGYYPKIEASSINEGNTWKKCQELAFELIRTDLEDGWEVDQSSWGPWCIKYQSTTSWNWMGYILLGVFTGGIGFFLPFLVGGKNFIELRGVEVTLRRRKKT